MNKNFRIMFVLTILIGVVACSAATPIASHTEAGPPPTPGKNPGELWYAFVTPQDVVWIDVPEGDYNNAKTLQNGEMVYQSTGLSAQPVYIQLPSIDKIAIDHPSDYAVNKFRLGKAASTAPYFEPIFEVTLDSNLRLAVTLCGWPHLYLMRPSGESWQIAVVPPLTSTCK